MSAPSVPEQQAPLERVHLPRSISAPPGRLVRDGSAPAALAAGQLRGFCTRRDKPFARGAGSVSGSVGDEERKVLQIVLGPLSSFFFFHDPTRGPVLLAPPRARAQACDAEKELLAIAAVKHKPGAKNIDPCCPTNCGRLKLRSSLETPMLPRISGRVNAQRGI